MKDSEDSEVEIVYETVVEDGRSVVRCGRVVSIFDTTFWVRSTLTQYLISSSRSFDLFTLLSAGRFFDASVRL